MIAYKETHYQAKQREGSEAVTFILTLVQLGHHLRQQGKIWRNEDQKIQQSQGSCTR